MVIFFRIPLKANKVIHSASLVSIACFNAVAFYSLFDILPIRNA